MTSLHSNPPPIQKQQQQQQQKKKKNKHDSSSVTLTPGRGGNDKTSHSIDAQSGGTHRIEDEEEEEEAGDDFDNDEHQEQLEQKSIESDDLNDDVSFKDGDDHRHHHPVESGKKGGVSLMLAHKETRAVHAGLCLVFVVLMLAASTLAILTYWFTANEERQAFETAFTNIATQLANAANRNVKQSMNIIQSVSTAATSYASQTDSKWPYVTIPDFEVQMHQIRALSGGQMIFFTPIIADETLDAWGMYSTQNQAWIEEGLHVINDGYQVDNQVNHTDPGRIPPFLHTLQGNKVPMSPRGYYAPLWQFSPPPSTANMVNLDLFYIFPWFETLSSEVLMTRHPILSETIDMHVLFSSKTTQDNNEDPIVAPAANEEGYESTQQHQQEQVHSILMYPVFETFAPDAPIRGFLLALVPWEEYFHNVLQVENYQQQQQQHHGSPLKADTDVSAADKEEKEAQQQQQLQNLPPPVVVEVQEVACHNTAMTFVVQGSKACFVGNGLLHDRHYQSLGRTIPFATFTQTPAPESSSEATQLPCLHDFRLTMYPTSALEKHYQTHDLVVFTAMVLAIFAFTVVMFLLYDYLVRRRQNIVMNTACRTTALVASLFPKTVQGRILDQQQQQRQGGKGKDANSIVIKNIKSSSNDNAGSNNKNWITNSRDELEAFLGKRIPASMITKNINHAAIERKFCNTIGEEIFRIL